MMRFNEFIRYGCAISFLLVFGFICFSLGSSRVNIPCTVSAIKISCIMYVLLKVLEDLKLNFAFPGLYLHFGSILSL